MNFTLLFAIINLLLFVTISYYFFIQRREIDKNRVHALEEQKLHDEEFEKDEARLEKDLQDAKEKAEIILSQSQKIAQDLIFELEKALGKENGKRDTIIPSKSHFEEELINLSAKIKEQYVKRISNLLKDLNKFELGEAKKVEELAQQQELQTDQALHKVSSEKLAKIKEEIEQYKKEEIMLFDKKVKDTVNQAAKEVLGHALTHGEQKELIIKALEKARRENII